MLRSKAKWKFFNDETESSGTFSANTKLSRTMIELLKQRGINSQEASDLYLSPELEQLHNPEGLSTMKKASDRIHRAISTDEKILIYGDYDADGVSSTTLMLKALQELGANCDFYIPNRFSEGYGPNEAAFRKIHKEGFSVIITVDTGIASVYEATIAKELGIDLIITDHHELQDELPEAYALINPKCSPDYPFEDLAGVGVAFKLAEQLLGYFPKHLLDLVAIGTIADLVPLRSENRVLAYFGLRELTLSKNVGIKALKKICNIDGDVNEQDIGFSIGPRLNAVGRLQDASLAVQLLMSEDEHEAEEIATEIEDINEERKEIVRLIVDEVDKEVDLDNRKGVTIIAKEGWNEGVLGIVASQLVRKHDQPAIVLTIKPDLGIVKGSARSIPAFNLFENGMKMRHLFTHFGGHSQAAGMTFPIENLAEIKSLFNELINEQLTDEDFKQVIIVDKTIELDEVDEKLIAEVEQLAPFGMENPKPVFHVRAIPTEARQLGNLKNHLKLIVGEEQKKLDVIGFGMGDLFPHITPHTCVSIVGEVGINEWNGIRKPQIIMRDMNIDEWQLFDHRGKQDIKVASYIRTDEHVMILSANKNEKLSVASDQITTFTYDMNLEKSVKIDRLFIYDLPPRLETLTEIIKVTKPDNIHVCFYVEDSLYLTSFPSRAEFTWFYSLVIKHKEIDFKKELTHIMDLKKWSKERTIFIANVFLELNFVKIDDGVVKFVPNPIKKDLTESSLYQDRINRGNIEKLLYYSNYEALRKWFANSMVEKISTKEEVLNGL